MSVQILKSDGKPAFAVLPYGEYELLRELADDAADAAWLLRFARRRVAGKEETLPARMVDRLLRGESALRAWREHRGLTAARLAAAAGVTPAHISKIESGKGDPSLSVLRRLAKVLGISIDDLAGNGE